jgi:hypothetical protein
MKIFDTYFFIGFDDDITATIYHHVLALIEQSASGSDIGDYEIKDKQEHDTYMQIQAKVTNFFIKVRKKQLLREINLVLLFQSQLADIDRIIKSVNQEPGESRFFFCFSSSYLANGFSGIELMLKDDNLSFTKGNLTSLLRGIEKNTDVCTVIYENEAGQKKDHPIYSTQNKGLKLHGNRFATYKTNSKFRDYRSFNYFLDIPVLYVDQYINHSKSLLC